MVLLLRSSHVYLEGSWSVAPSSGVFLFHGTYPYIQCNISVRVPRQVVGHFDRVSAFYDNAHPICRRNSRMSHESWSRFPSVSVCEYSRPSQSYILMRSWISRTRPPKLLCRRLVRGWSWKDQWEAFARSKRDQRHRELKPCSAVNRYKCLSNMPPYRKVDLI